MYSTYRMKSVFAVWTFVIVVLFGVIVCFSIYYKKQLKIYKTLEGDIAKMVEDYIGDNEMYPVSGTSVKMTFDELKEDNVIKTTNVKNDSCKGYVIVKNEGNLDVNTYLSCKFYITKDYRKN